MSKKILYISCHEILEYDELRLFSELGYECYSIGAYTQPGGDEHRKRPALKLPYNPHFIELALQYHRENLHPEMLEGIDVIIIMHDTRVITENWPLFKQFIAGGGRVVWRTIGQSIPARERELKAARAEGLEVVRYSIAESTIAHNIGTDATIYFYKDEDEYKGYSGKVPRVVNFTQSLKERGRFCGYETFMQVTEGFPRIVFGPNNSDLGELDGGLLSYDEQLKQYRDNRAYFYHGTYPASYTLTFIEGLMTGIPMVCVGPNTGNAYDMFPQQDTYEVPQIIQNGVNGYVSDDVNVLRGYIQQLLDNPRLAKSIGDKGRETAIEYFGMSKALAQWKEFLERK